MDTEAASARLSALSHSTRLAIFRLLVQAGPEGLAAGEIARRLSIIPNTLSAALSILSQTRLVQAQRSGRFIVYAAHYPAMVELLTFLVSDCCGGALDVCAPLNAALDPLRPCAALPILESA
jgi:DNA-binding transcriptional ArsR family regulator